MVGADPRVRPSFSRTVPLAPLTINSPFRLPCIPPGHAVLPNGSFPLRPIRRLACPGSATSWTGRSPAQRVNEERNWLGLHTGSCLTVLSWAGYGLPRSAVLFKASNSRISSSCFFWSLSTRKKVAAVKIKMGPSNTISISLPPCSGRFLRKR